MSLKFRGFFFLLSRALRGELGECVFLLGNDTLAENVPSRLLVEGEGGTRRIYVIGEVEKW